MNLTLLELNKSFNIVPGYSCTHCLLEGSFIGLLYMGIIVKTKQFYNMPKVHMKCNQSVKSATKNYNLMLCLVVLYGSLQILRYFRVFLVVFWGVSL